jgi:hypothetical protein
MAFEQHFRQPEPHKLGNGLATFARHVWVFIVAVMVVPAAIAWLIRAGFAIGGCEPAAAACFADPANGIALTALKSTLDIAWMIGANTLVALGLTTLAAMAAIIGVRPINAAFTVLLMPHAVLFLPKWLVDYTAYPGCAVSEAHIGNCVLWGTKMGDAFHSAAVAYPSLIYTYTPFAVAGALIAGLLGWIVYWGACKVARAHENHIFKRTADPRSRG